MSRYRPQDRQLPPHQREPRGYESWTPQRDANGSRSHQGQRDRDRDRDQGFRGPFSDLRNQGASNNYNSFRPPQSDFNFRSEAPQSIRNNNDSYHVQRNDRDSHYRPGQQENQRSFLASRPPNRFNRGNQRFNPRGRGGRPPPRFAPKASDRPMLNQRLDQDAELMLGDTTNRTTYRNPEDLSDDDEAAMDISGDSASEADEPATKRVRLASDAAMGQSVPKWSNADPYDALPPPSIDTQRKKVDVVQLIRKARVDVEKKPSTAEGADFISCDFSDGEKEDSAPEAPASAPLPTLPSAQTDGKQRVDLAPSTALGNRKRTFDDQIKLPHAKLTKPARMPSGFLLLPMWKVKKDVDACPWANGTDHSDTKIPAVRLHKEIVDFFEYVRPRDYEERIRNEMVDKLNALVKKRWADASVLAFGSFKSGLYLPTADMDLVICSRRFLNGHAPLYAAKKNIWALKAFFASNHVAYPNEFEVITGAKVPLLKYCDSATALKIDISFEKLDGVRAIDTFLGWKKTYPAMPILVSLIKHFLCMRGLNEPVNGGVGGFSIICLVVHLLNIAPQIQSRSMNPEHHLGELLVEFFRYYGEEFEFSTVAIRMYPNRSEQVNKHEVSSIVYRNMDRLSIIDPNNHENDISGGSKNFQTIRNAFADAYWQITRRQAQLAKADTKIHGYNTILATILAGDYSSFEVQRQYMERFAIEGLPDLVQNQSYWDKVVAW